MLLVNAPDKGSLAPAVLYPITRKVGGIQLLSQEAATDKSALASEAASEPGKAKAKGHCEAFAWLAQHRFGMRNLERAGCGLATASTMYAATQELVGGGGGAVAAEGESAAARRKRLAEQYGRRQEATEDKTHASTPRKAQPKKSEFQPSPTSAFRATAAVVVPAPEVKEKEAAKLEVDGILEGLKASYDKIVKSAGGDDAGALHRVRARPLLLVSVVLLGFWRPLSLVSLVSVVSGLLRLLSERSLRDLELALSPFLAVCLTRCLLVGRLRGLNVHAPVSGGTWTDIACTSSLSRSLPQDIAAAIAAVQVGGAEEEDAVKRVCELLAQNLVVKPKELAARYKKGGEGGRERTAWERNENKLQVYLRMELALLKGRQKRIAAVKAEPSAEAEVVSGVDPLSDVQMKSVKMLLTKVFLLDTIIEKTDLTATGGTGDRRALFLRQVANATLLVSRCQPVSVVFEHQRSPASSSPSSTIDHRHASLCT